jgi:anti-sigma28 factor (negative regulator of flagellin synthesis)
LARPDGAGKPAAGQGAGSGDRVQISSLAEALTTSQSQRAATVQRLAAAYRNGSYQVDSTSIARALLNESLEAGGTESKP